MPYRLFLIILTVILLFVLVIASASAEGGDPDRGRTYAEQACAGCHAIRRGDADSPVAKATPLETVANVRGMTETALAVFFRTPHPTMPNLIIAGRDLDDVIAYIRSLRTEP